MKLFPSKDSNKKSSPRRDAKLNIWNRLITGRKKSKAGNNKNRPPLSHSGAGNDKTAVPKRTALAKNEPVLMLAERARSNACRSYGCNDPAAGYRISSSRPLSLAVGTATTTAHRPPRTTYSQTNWRRRRQALSRKEHQANHESTKGSDRALSYCTTITTSLFQGEEEATLDDTLDETLEDTLDTFSSANDTLFDDTATAADERIPSSSDGEEVSLFLCGKILDQVGLRSPDDSKEQKEAWNDLILDLLFLA